VLQVEKPRDFRAEHYLQHMQYLLYVTRIKKMVGYPPGGTARQMKIAKL
jgi:hypothetical protein